MLTFILDNIHEDLNRIRTKPYMSIEEQKSTENDKEAAERWWNIHKARENSIIVDLFHGQYKTKTACPDCKSETLNYDAFMYLSLPIPNEMIKLSIKVINFLANQKNVFDMKNHQVYVNDMVAVSEIIEKLARKDPLEKVEMIVVNSNTKSFKRVAHSNEKILNIVNKENELVLYIFKNEETEEPKAIQSVYFNLVDFYEEKSFSRQINA